MKRCACVVRRFLFTGVFFLHYSKELNQLEIFLNTFCCNSCDYCISQLLTIVAIFRLDSIIAQPLVNASPTFPTLPPNILSIRQLVKIRLLKLKILLLNLIQIWYQLFLFLVTVFSWIILAVSCCFNIKLTLKCIEFCTFKWLLSLSTLPPCGLVWWHSWLWTMTGVWSRRSGIIWDSGWYFGKLSFCLGWYFL